MKLNNALMLAIFGGIATLAPSLSARGGGSAFGYGLLGGAVGSTLFAPRTYSTEVVYVDRPVAVPVRQSRSSWGYDEDYEAPRKTKQRKLSKRELKAQLAALEAEEKNDREEGGNNDN